MSLLLQASRNGGLDMGTRSIEAQRCLQAGDPVGYLVAAFHMPRNMAIRNVAHTDVNREFPHLDQETRYRVAEQRARINGYTPTPEKRAAAPSSSEINRRVAEVGRLVLQDQQTLRSADNADDGNDVTCPKCGHTFSPEEAENRSLNRFLRRRSQNRPKP